MSLGGELATALRSKDSRLLRAVLAKQDPEDWEALRKKENPWADLARFGTLAMAQVLQAVLPYADEPLHKGITPFLWAASAGNQDLMWFCLANGANRAAFDEYGNSVWVFLASPDSIDLLLDMSDALPPLNKEAIIRVVELAILQQDARVMQLLIDHGMDPLHVLSTVRAGNPERPTTPWSQVCREITFGRGSPVIHEMARMLMAEAGPRITLEEVVAVGHRELVYAWVALTGDTALAQVLTAMDPLASLPQADWVDFVAGQLQPGLLYQPGCTAGSGV